MEENIGKQSVPQGAPHPENKKNKWDARILGLNLLILAAYTIASKLIEGGIFLDAFLIVAHLFCCIIIGGTRRNWAWVLSGLLVLVIGFATCIEVVGR
ncbi:MAG: hypothetical protein ACHQF4_11500 [Sphingobacteriales bacterium]